MRAMRILIILAICCAVILMGCQQSEEGEVEVEAPGTPVVVSNPEIGTITSWHTATADLMSPMESMLSFPNGGRIVELAAEEGDHVEAGQYLGKVDTSTLGAQHQAAMSQVDALRNQARAAEVGIDVARSQAEQARAAFDQAEADYERYQNLRDEGVATEAEFEQIELRYESARLTLESAEDGVIAAQAQADAARSGIQAARDQAGQVSEMIDDGTLRAPYSGYISERRFDPGEVAGPGTSIYKIVADEASSNNRLEVRFNVPETLLESIHEGMDVLLQIRSCDDAIRTSIVTIFPEVNMESRTVELRSYIDREATDCRPGMFGTVRIPLETVENAVLLPEEAVLTLDGTNYVFVAIGDTVERREVTTGIRESGTIQIVEGVTETDEVVVEGNSFLKDGAKIQRMSEEDTEAEGLEQPAGGES